MKKPSNQSNIAHFAVALVGTTSILLANHFNSNNIMPSNLYPYEYNQNQESGTYLLKHEIMHSTFKDKINEPLIEMPVIKTLKVKFNKPTPLEFNCLEDSEGFIG